jgi:hypothetical protein
MDSNDEGILWVQVLKFRSGYMHVVDALPIHWTKVDDNNSDDSTDQQQDIIEVLEICKDGDNGSAEFSSLESAEKVLSEPSLQYNPTDVICATNENQDVKGSRSGQRACYGSAPEAHYDRLCILCVERPAELQLLPCRHDRFCRRCIVETVGTQIRPTAAPPCPLCRAAIRALVITRLKVRQDQE